MSGISRKKLTEDEIGFGLSEVSGWRVEDGVLTKSFSFEGFSPAVLFVNVVAFLAEGLDHHPDIELGYGKVTVSVSTHDAGGLTDFDFELARRIDALG